MKIPIITDVKTFDERMKKKAEMEKKGISLPRKIPSLGDGIAVLLKMVKKSP